MRKQLQQEQDLLQQSQESKEAELLLQHEREKLSLDEKVGNSKGDLENQVCVCVGVCVCGGGGGGVRVYAWCECIYIIVS